MNIMFVHQNMPGQYRELVQWLAESGEHKIYFLTQRQNAPKIDGVQTRVYKPHRTSNKDSYGLSKVWEEATGAGFGAAMAAKQIEREDGFKPDLVVGHVGWGELTFFKQIWEDVPIIGFFEYYYLFNGGPVNFDKEEPVNEHTPFLLHARNAVPAANIMTVDRALSPTKWQRDCFPEIMHEKIYVCHDGIRTDKLKPNPKAMLKLGRVDKPVGRDDEIVGTLMSCEIINRHADVEPFGQCVEVMSEQLSVQGIGVIEVDLVALFKRQVPQVLVVGIERQHRATCRIELCCQLRCEAGLTRAAATRDADEK